MNREFRQGHFHLHSHECAFGVDSASDHVVSLKDSRGAERTGLLFVLVITVIVMAAEFVGGWLAGSLALIGDSGHMLTDAMALGVGLLAILFASRPPTDRNSFGFHRLEILAALFNGVLLCLLTIWIFMEAIRRLNHPWPIAGNVMLWIGALGLAANLIAAFILREGRRSSLNLRSAYLHVLGDTLSSGGVVVAAVIIAGTGWTAIDPLLSILLCAVILISAFRLIRDSVDILLEAAPRKIDGAALIETLKMIDEVQDVHDVHIWTLTSGLHAFSAHVAVPDVSVSQTSGILKRINFILCQQHGIGHTAIQFEARKPGDRDESGKT